MVLFSAELEKLATDVLKSVREFGALPKCENKIMLGNAVGINVERGFLAGIDVCKNANGDYIGRLVGTLALTPAGERYIAEI